MNPLSLVPLIDNFSDFNIAVVGDIMLDRYVWGQAGRISQEAPVPIIRVDHTSEVPGGAANVAANISALSGKAALYGIAGKDREGDALGRVLREKGIDGQGIAFLENRKTTVKTRIIGNRQQIARVDAEETSQVPETDRNSLYKKLAADIADNKFRGIVFEDYAKGLLSSELIQRLIDLADRHSIFTILDPHPSHNFNVSGLQAMTPNRSEAFGLTGTYYRDSVLPLEDDLPLQQVGQRIMQAWQTKLLLITLGATGMALFSQEQAQQQVPRHIPTRAQEVFDVSGAGDTVTASFSLAMLAGASPFQAAHLANHAAGIVVGKIGTASVTAEELRANLKEEHE